MKAMLLKRTGPVETEPLEMVELPIPQPGPDEIRLHIRACGVCRTDLHTVEGDLDLPKLPVVPGHQVAGVVDAVGECVRHFKEGERAGAIWLYRTCGECTFCRQGRENLCERAEFTGFHADGGYAEYMVLNENFAYHLPAGITYEKATPLLCGGVIGYRALRLSEVHPGQRLGLYGFGNSAHVTIQVARHWHCRVFVFTRSSEHQEHARRLGAEWVGTAEEEPPERLDAAVVFAPAGELVPKVLAVLEKGGTVALAGIHMTPIPQMPYRLLYGERTVRSVANSTRQDAVDLLRLAAEIPIRTDTTTYPLEEANRVLLALKESRISGDAVLLP